MVVVQLTGGLGNQMFQFAAAKCLATKSNSEVKVDVSAFEDDSQRKFDLEAFRTSLTIATNKEINRYRASTAFGRLLEKAKPYSLKRFYNEPFFHFDPSFFHLKAPVYLKGYFQSEKYFREINEVIKREFSLKENLPAKLTRFSTQLKSQQSVALHIRRGDYQSQKANAYHGILQACYYRDAVSCIKEKMTNAKFYLFSDNAGEIQTELGLYEATMVSGNMTSNHFEDLHLMSQCRHIIIANSSFSWWAAWLNQNPDKVVIAPKRWFNQGPKDTQDLLPDSWIRI